MTGFRIFVTILCVAGFLNACTDTERARATSLGIKADIVCYSGGKEIYHGRSTGKVLNAEHSDGYEFVEDETSKLIRITADCIVKN